MYCFAPFLPLFCYNLVSNYFVRNSTTISYSGCFLYYSVRGKIVRNSCFLINNIEPSNCSLIFIVKLFSNSARYGKFNYWFFILDWIYTK
jgi:hypothetical protein